MQRLRKWRWWILSGLIAFAGAIVIFLLLADRYVEPILKQRLHTLIVEGSDSLYTYSLGDLRVSFFGGNVEIDELRVQVDSNQYYKLQARNALPSLTIDLDMQHGHLHGLSVLPLVFGRKISVHELRSKDANLRLTRQKKSETGAPQKQKQAFWKLIQPDITKISINRIRLDGLKLLYKSADTAQSMKLQFDTCNAKLRHIRIDSIGAFDTSRIGFAKEVELELKDIKFRTADSSSKMKAEAFRYSSNTRTLEVEGFKVQPTIKDKEAYYRSPDRKEGMSVIEIGRGLFTGFRLEKYITDNFFIADSLIIEEPVISQYQDKTYPPFLQSKVGTYPHQQLLKANSYISINGVRITKGKLSYTEKGERTKQEGTIELTELNITAGNITNDPARIKKQPKAFATMQGKIFRTSPLTVRFTFHLDSTEGQYDADGEIHNVTAAQLNPVASTLANSQLTSFNMHQLLFKIHGDDYGGKGEVRMRYDNLAVVLYKTNKEDGSRTVNNFFTQVLNKYVVHYSNPGPDGIERVARNVRKSRQSYQPFFGSLWRTIFSGVQDVMLRSGSIE